MQRIWTGRLLAAAAVIGLTVTAASADEATVQATAKLNGFHEVLPKLTDGTGTFSATLKGDTLTYTLTYTGLSTPAFMAHIHFAQPGVNGGIFIWLCGSAAAPGPAGTPPCKPGGGTVTGTVHPSAIQAVSTPGAGDQGVPADGTTFAGVLRILESGDAYVNVHTTRYPGGEIRGQIKADTESSD